MCLVSIAFFASCNPEGQPTINAHLEDGYIQNGDVVSYSDTVYFGFDMSYSLASGSKLSNLVVKVDDEEWDNIDLNGETEYVYTSAMVFNKKEMIGCVISAVVTDYAGQTASSTITFSIDSESPIDDEPLMARTFDWCRKGLTLESEEEMAAVGLTWPGNYRDNVYVTIKPLAGCSMYIIEDGDKFDAIKTEGEKEAFFNELTETATPDTQYKEIRADQGGTYNTMLAVIDDEGETHLVHFNRATAELVTAGALIHLFGELK